MRRAFNLPFAQIESIICGLLPRGAAEQQWWCANGLDDHHAPHHRAWLDAGFEAIPEPKAERVYFRKRTTR